MVKINEFEHMTRDNIVKKNPRRKVVYGGIIDDMGVESFTTDDENRSAFPFALRAQANRERNAIFYTVKLSQSQADEINKLINERKFQAAADRIVSYGMDTGNKLTADNHDIFMRWWELRSFNKRKYPDKGGD